MLKFTFNFGISISWLTLYFLSLWNMTVFMSQSCLKFTPRKECNSSSSHYLLSCSCPFAICQFYLFSSDYLYTFTFLNDFSILFSHITLYYLVYQEVPPPKVSFNVHLYNNRLFLFSSPPNFYCIISVLSCGICKFIL